MNLSGCIFQSNLRTNSPMLLCVTLAEGVRESRMYSSGYPIRLKEHDNEHGSS